MSLREKVGWDIQQNIGIYLIILLIYTVCAISGAFTVAALSDELLNQVQNFLCSALQYGGEIKWANVWFHSMLIFVIFTALNVAGSFHIVIWPFTVVGVCFSGLSAGFMTRLLVVTFGVKGGIIGLVSVWIPEMIFLFTRSKCMQIAYNTAANYIGRMPNKDKVYFVLFTLLSLVGVFWQCTVSPAICRLL